MIEPEVNIDSVISRLIEGNTSRSHNNKLFVVRGSRPGKAVNLAENEIRYLCIKSRQIFLSQPILLELEAPIKICGIR